MHTGADSSEQARRERRTHLVEHVHAVVEPCAVRGLERAVTRADVGRAVDERRAIAERREHVSSDQSARAGADHDGVEVFEFSHIDLSAGHREGSATTSS